ncbi:MAG: hypothetical protein KAG89_04275 [Fulvimarina manganoxydans]|uniref:hypothetical protein n=1 Tax=Fulvimarina manganoxydans TaxID=937218 RepID=UPI00235652AB|nr:hypothetical protein [Fulvimarina manganoxydans]MCK5931368.1 hypothetical protein [Fulvimarina manganoxydans]
MKISTIAWFSYFALVTASSAQPVDGNTLTLVQRGGDRTSVFQSGSGNTLTIDQSAATSSVVGGLRDSKDGSVISATDQTYSYSVEVPNPKAFIEKSDGTYARNVSEKLTMSEPQSITVGTLGAAFSPQEPLRQIGTGNTATITVSDSVLFNGGIATAGQVGLYQNNTDSTQSGNEATITAYGNATALVGQLGGNNSAILNVAVDGTGSIFQMGDNNKANLTVPSGGSGLISQIGDNNDTTLTVAPGSAASYIIYGDNIAQANASGVSVQSNGSSVSVTQYR